MSINLFTHLSIYICVHVSVFVCTQISSTTGIFLLYELYKILIAISFFLRIYIKTLRKIPFKQEAVAKPVLYGSYKRQEQLPY